MLDVALKAAYQKKEQDLILLPYFATIFDLKYYVTRVVERHGISYHKTSITIYYMVIDVL